jgi:adenine-specific DNA-methyltransferase
MGQTSTASRMARAVQLPLLSPPPPQAWPASVETKGVVYTKSWVVELLLDLAGYTPEVNLVDKVAIEPAAGEGAFLGIMVARLAESCRRQQRPLTACQNSVLAYELDEVSASRARELVMRVLAEQALDGQEAERLATAWIRTGDYLLDAPDRDADFVVGNPPYVRLEDIPEEFTKYYRNAYPTMRGRADLYVAFFEAALRQLKPDGVCAFICADRWMRNQYGADLRKLVTSGYSMDVIVEMHNADAFHDEVDAYPAVTVIRAGKQRSTIVASATQEAQNVDSRVLSAAITLTDEESPPVITEGLHVAKVHTWFKGTDPWPCNSPEQLTLLRRLEDGFPPLESNAKVGIGVATGNDRIFITRDVHLVEPSRLLKLALAKDISSGTMKWSGHFLIDPWNLQGLVPLERFPKLRSYFGEHEEDLKKRHTAIKSLGGWYKTIDRVTHALTSKQKLYIADIKNVLDPVLDAGETYPHHNLYFIESEVWNLEVLGGLLMSLVGQFFVESYGVRMRGGYWRFQAQYLRRIRVPSPESISELQGRELIRAFRTRDSHQATKIALKVYGIEPNEMEKALGH